MVAIAVPPTPKTADATVLSINNLEEERLAKYPETINIIRAGIAHKDKATEAIVKDRTPLKCLCTIFTFMPYRKVANTTKPIK